jgi:phosphatidylserine decarboxylase
MQEHTIYRENDEQPYQIAGFDPDVAPLLGFGLGLTGIVLGLRPRFAPIPLALTAMAALFYRDPNRTTPDNPKVLFSVADGTVFGIDEVYEHRFLHTDALRITTMISPLDIPVNRSPVAGEVQYVDQIQGDHHPVWMDEAPLSNTRTYIGIKTAWGTVLVSLVARMLSRQVASRVQVGDTLGLGERIGTVRFGSRADIIVQRDSIEPLVAVGQRLTAGCTPIARVVPLSSSATAR